MLYLFTLLLTFVCATVKVTWAGYENLSAADAKFIKDAITKEFNVPNLRMWKHRENLEKVIWPKLGKKWGMYMTRTLDRDYSWNTQPRSTPYLQAYLSGGRFFMIFKVKK